jgi:hypothetical protein
VVCCVDTCFAFHSIFIGERDSRRASTGEPRDRFGHIGWCPVQLFPSFNLYFYDTHPPPPDIQASESE